MKSSIMKKNDLLVNGCNTLRPKYMNNAYNISHIILYTIFKSEGKCTVYFRDSLININVNIDSLRPVK